MSIFFKNTVESTELRLQTEFFNVLEFMSDVFSSNRAYGENFVVASKINKCTSEPLERVQYNKYIRSKISNRLVNNLTKLRSSIITKKSAFIAINNVEYPVESIRLSLYIAGKGHYLLKMTKSNCFLHPESYIEFFNARDVQSIDNIKSGEFSQENSSFVKNNIRKFINASINGTEHISKDLLLKMTFVYSKDNKNFSITKTISKYDLKSVAINSSTESLSTFKPNVRENNIKIDEECVLHCMSMEFLNIKVTVGSFMMFEYYDRAYNNLNSYNIKDAFMQHMDHLMSGQSATLFKIKKLINNRKLHTGYSTEQVLADFVYDAFIQFNTSTVFHKDVVYAKTLQDIVRDNVFKVQFDIAITTTCKIWEQLV